jgi:LysM repeat protein
MNSMKNFNAQNTLILLPGRIRIVVKWLCVLIGVSFTAGICAAQQNTLVIGGSTPELFLIHKVTSKENFYSIGRMYNVPPKDVAAYNNLQFENGLSVGESIKIPLKENNFSQSEAAGSGQVLIPVYHTLQPKEGLYRVSLHYNKVPIGSLKKWNHIQSDAVSTGRPLIVGYLKVAKDASPFAGKEIQPDVDAAAVKKNEPQPAASTEALPPVKKADISKQKSDEQDTGAHKVTVTRVNTKSSINFSGGFFKGLYNGQAAVKTPVSESGKAGIFKSTSGWQDGKYYCFNNTATRGTVIKITYDSTKKSVYAKVLDAIPDIKQNADLTLILSNAAAEELGASEGRFDCTLSYVK